MGYIELTQEDMKIQKQLLAQYRNAYEKLPAGNLNYKTIKGKIYYYHVDEAGKQQYINKNRSNLVYDLTYKRFLAEAIKRIEGNLKLQRKVLTKYRPYDPHSIYRSLPKTYSNTASQKNYQPLRDTNSAEDVSDDYYPEGRIFRTSFGLYLRSKSEVLIAELLHAANIPFQYEASIRIKSTDTGQWITYRPDFTIVTPQGKTIYWEHAGLLSKKDYRDKFFEKLSNYHYNQIVMPDNLIVTMDGPNGALDIAAINRIIQAQLLPLFQNEGNL